MPEDKPTFTPPSIESQYWSVHPSHIPPEQLEEMKRQISETGVYVGKITQFSGLTGAVEVIEPDSPGVHLRIMPGAIPVPVDHPSRQRSQEVAGFVIGAALTPPQPMTIPGEQLNTARVANERARQTVQELGTTHEALADFLEVFVAADKMGESGYARMAYCGDDRVRVKFIEGAGQDETTYALIRDGIYRGNHLYTIVSMATGDQLSFVDSDVERIRTGNYVQPTSEGGASTIDLRSIAEVAGIINPYDESDPITSLTKDSASAATLKTDEQIQRFERLISLGSEAAKNAHVAFAPETAQEMLTFLGSFGAKRIASYIHEVIIPVDTAPVAIDDKENRFVLSALLETTSKFGIETQRAIYGRISAIDVRSQKDNWSRANNIQKLIRDAVRFDQDGNHTEHPSFELIERLLCDRYDFLEAVYKAADGLYVECSSHPADGSKPTRFASENLNESKARTLAELLQGPLMDTVEEARSSLHIPDGISPADQIVLLLKGHGYTQKGVRLTRREDVAQVRPDITVPQWAEICMIIDRCRISYTDDGNRVVADISDADRAVIESHGLNADAMRKYWKSAPGATTEGVAQHLLRFQRAPD
jgi:hypothetical protein